MAQKHDTPEYVDAPMTRAGTLELVASRRQIRSDAFTAARWAAVNPILQLGEIGYETDTNKLKVGDGVTEWNNLGYVGGGSSLPDQDGHAGEFLTTDGTDASWGAVESLPSQTGHSGEFLTTDGTDASWGAVSEVPSTTGASEGDVLTVDSNGDAVWQAGGSGGGLPSQTGNAGKFLTTDGTDASWSDKPLVNTGTSTGQLNITTVGGTTNTGDRGGVSINIGSDIKGGSLNDYGGIRLGKNINTSNYGYSAGIYMSRGGIDIAGGSVIVNGGTSIVGNSSGKVGGILIVGNGKIGIGPLGSSSGSGAHSLAVGSTNNSIDIRLNADNSTLINNGYATATTITENNTFWWGNNNGLYKLFDTDGTIPTDRFTTTPSADGTYVPTLTISSGVATRTWGSGGGGGLQNTATGTESLGILNDQSGNYNTVVGVKDTSFSSSVNGATTLGYKAVVSSSEGAVAIGRQAKVGANNTSDGGIAIGYLASTTYGGLSSTNAICIGKSSHATGSRSLAIGSQAVSGAAGAIQLGGTSTSSATTNSDANTFKVANANGNFELMDANGNLPADRLASTTGLADGNYRLRLVMASGVPTLEWVAE